MELSALAADLASLPLSFTPIGAATSLATGIYGTAADVWAKTQKGEKGIGKALATGAGLTALSLLPGGKAASVGRRLVKMIPKLVAAGMVAPGAIDAATKLANGERVSLDELKMLTMGINMAGHETVRAKNTIASKNVADYARTKPVETAQAEPAKPSITGKEVLAEGVTEEAGPKTYEFSEKALTEAKGKK